MNNRSIKKYITKRITVNGFGLVNCCGEILRNFCDIYLFAGLFAGEDRDGYAGSRAAGNNALGVGTAGRSGIYRPENYGRCVSCSDDLFGQ